MSESPEELGALLTRAHRMSDAANALVKVIYERYVTALDATWTEITDEEILASEERKRELCQAAFAQKWASVRLHKMLPDGAGMLMHQREDDDSVWRPTYQLHLAPSLGSAPDLEVIKGRIRALARDWAMGRRLIKFDVLGKSLGETRQRIWIEYEPATDQGRVMSAYYGSGEQHAYGKLADLLIVAQHVAETDE
jgi:hypothetical protein